LHKHGNRPGSAFPQPKGSPSDINKAGQAIVDDILTHPDSTIEMADSSRFGQVREVRAPDGRGLRYDTNNILIGFLEP
jgi:filamentous hemagglutinin